MPRREKRGKCDAQVVRHSLIDRAGPLIRHVSRPGLAEREALPARYYLGGVCGEGGGAREGSPRGLIATWGGPFLLQPVVGAAGTSGVFGALVIRRKEGRGRRRHHRGWRGVRRRLEWAVSILAGRSSCSGKL